MAYLTVPELKSAIYDYQLLQIVEDDLTIAEMAISAAIEEVKSLLTPNNKKAWGDGRKLYDTDAIFSQTGDARNGLLLTHTKSVAVWYVTQLSNVDIVYQQVKDRYDRAITYLKDLAAGNSSITTLPVLPSEDDADNPASKKPFRFGSRTKFNHE